MIFDEDGVKVTAFLVDHAPVVPAFGYRVDYRLITFTKGVDVLIHEAVDPVAMRVNAVDRALTESIIAHHTTGEQAGQVFTRVQPRLAVFSHASRHRCPSGPGQGPLFRPFAGRRGSPDHRYRQGDHRAAVRAVAPAQSRAPRRRAALVTAHPFI